MLCSSPIGSHHALRPPFSFFANAPHLWKFSVPLVLCTHCIQLFTHTLFLNNNFSLPSLSNLIFHQPLPPYLQLQLRLRFQLRLRLDRWQAIEYIVFQSCYGTVHQKTSYSGMKASSCFIYFLICFIYCCSYFVLPASHGMNEGMITLIPLVAVTPTFNLNKLYYIVYTQSYTYMGIYGDRIVFEFNRAPTSLSSAVITVNIYTGLITYSTVLGWRPPPRGGPSSPPFF